MDSVSKYMEQQEVYKESTKDDELQNLAREVRTEIVFTLEEIRDDSLKRGIYRNLLNNFLEQLNKVKYA